MKLVGWVTVFYILITHFNPVGMYILDLAQPGANNNHYSPYSMYQRCHPAQFHIPTGLSC